MNQRGSLQRVAGRFVRHFVRSQVAEFRIKERKQFLSDLGIALLNGVEDAGDIAHSASLREDERECTVKFPALRAVTDRAMQKRLNNDGRLNQRRAHSQRISWIMRARDNARTSEPAVPTGQVGCAVRSDRVIFE